MAEDYIIRQPHLDDAASLVDFGNRLLAETSFYLRSPGEWNFQRVTVRGSRITVELNGTTILDRDVATVKKFMYDEKKFAGRHRTKGHFGLAGHSDPVAYRTLRIKRL